MYTTDLPAEILDHIETWKNKKGNLIMILHKVQEYYGYIPRKAALDISLLLDIPLAKIYGIITFYHLFKLKKPGKNRISVCMGTACYLTGAADILSELETILGIGVNDTTDDGLFSIEAVRCLGCCGLAPVMTINGKVFGKIKKDQTASLISGFRNPQEK
jgi:NADH-quinone oxidoreductase subunit E